MYPLILLEASNPHCFSTGVPNILERRKQRRLGKRVVWKRVRQVYRDDKSREIKKPYKIVKE